MIPLRRLALVLVLSLCAPALRAAPPPQELIEKAARGMLQALDAEREVVRRDPARVRRLVDEILLPHFDTDYAARLVLGRHWRAATPAQRERFTEAFYQSLLRTYGASIADFTAARLIVLPFRGDLASGQAIVRTEVRRDDGTRVPVSYTLRATPAGWKAWDVTIEGISWVRNLRNDVGAEVEQRGLEALISRLENENRQAGTPDAAG
ncbi:MAG: ABC transporter substrate-binding protein [Gammaproteobacteria bacterium]|nr:ABC transporter substrate-binding protein [Gammaproteobacteria bacterium]